MQYRQDELQRTLELSQKVTKNKKIEGNHLWIGPSTLTKKSTWEVTEGAHLRSIGDITIDGNLTVDGNWIAKGDLE